MIKNIQGKFLGCLNGMIQAENSIGKGLVATTEAIDVARLLSDSRTPEELSHKTPPSSWTRASSAALIGLVFHDRFNDTFDFCRTESLFSSVPSQCAAIGAAVMVSSACFDVPPGVWPNEVGGIIKGVDDYFVSLIDHATKEAVEGSSSEEFFDSLSSNADPDGFIVTASMFSCLRGRTFDEAVKTAQLAGSHVTALTGAVMGAAFPQDGADEPLAKEILPILVARREF